MIKAGKTEVVKQNDGKPIEKPKETQISILDLLLLF